VNFNWYWYRILKFWYRDNTIIDLLGLVNKVK